jgi:Trk-type K+ transport system membrane component
MFLAASAFGNVGLTAEPRPLLGEMRTMFVLLPLSILGGVGLPVLIDLLDRIRGVRSRLLPHSRIVLMGLSIAFIVGTIVAFYFAVPQTLSDSTADGAFVPARDAFATSSTLTINARSAGFPLDRIDAFPRALPWFVMVLMLIGAGPAGTSGGLKITAFYVLIRDVLKLLRGEAPSRALAVSIVWITLLALAIGVTVLALAPSQAQLPGDRLLFLVISAACNVGLAHNPISINETNGYFLSAAMVLGRFLPIAVLWWQARVARDDVAVA